MANSSSLSGAGSRSFASRLRERRGFASAGQPELVFNPSMLFERPSPAKASSRAQSSRREDSSRPVLCAELERAGVLDKRLALQRAKQQRLEEEHAELTSRLAHTEAFYRAQAEKLQAELATLQRRGTPKEALLLTRVREIRERVDAAAEVAEELAH